MNLGVLASGQGTILQALIDASAEDQQDLRPKVVISNNSKSGAAERAQRNGIPFQHLSSLTHSPPGRLDQAICDTLNLHGVDLVVLAGYMKKLGQLTLTKYKCRIVNTHPALLPKFGGKGMYGSRVYEAVLEAGEQKTGVSIHLVDTEYDTGRVIAQCELPVSPNDTVETLAERVQRRERAFLIETLQAISEGRLQLSVT